MPAHRSEATGRAALATMLDAGLSELGLPLGTSVRERLLDYLDLLGKWNAVYNLTAVREPEAMLVQHLFDSLAIVAPLSRRAVPANVVDVGSGGGLPGMVLALAWPESTVHLVEPVGKKAAFLQQCVAELRIARARVHPCRVEDLSALSTVGVDLVVCRAFASLAAFVGAVDRLVAPATAVAAMKGVLPADEIRALPPQWRVAEALPLRVPRLDAQRHLLLLERAAVEDRPSPSGFAR